MMRCTILGSEAVEAKSPDSLDSKSLIIVLAIFSPETSSSAGPLP